MTSACRSVLFLSVSMIAGCGSGSVETKLPDVYGNLVAVKLAYMQSLQESGRPPAGFEAIKPFLAKQGDPKVLTCSPDGEPFVILWGVDIRSLRSLGGRPVWVYEKNSQNGKRWVVLDRSVEQMTDDQFGKAVFAIAGHQPKS